MLPDLETHSIPPPRATVVIPCFNHGRFVREAAASALAQAGAETRVVIVDDGSDDGPTPGACDACTTLDAQRVSVVHQRNRGLPAARNAGAAAARELGWGEYLAFLDADDYLEPTFVWRLHAELIAQQDHARAVSHAYCQERLVDRGEGVWAVPEWDPILLLVTNLHPVTALVRRECFEAAGGFDEAMRRGYEDWELWVRFSARGWRGARVREPLFNWRRHSDITMVIEAVARHDELYGEIMARNAEHFARHAPAVMRLANALLRKADANWLDESHTAIPLRDLRKANFDLWRDNTTLRERNGALRAKLRRAEAVQVRPGQAGPVPTTAG